MARRREPVGHTCPDIDKIIASLKQIEEYINSAVGGIEDIQNRTDGTNFVDEMIRAIKSDLSEAKYLADCSGMLEELREANSTLRSWGIDLADELETLEDQADDLNTKVENLEGDLEKANEATGYFQAQADELRNKNESLTTELEYLTEKLFEPEKA